MSNTKQIRKPKQYIDINYYLHSDKKDKFCLKCNHCGCLLKEKDYKCYSCGSYDVIDKE